MIAHAMQGVGSSVYYTLGIAYLDDNARKNKVPVLLGKHFLLIYPASQLILKLLLSVSA